MIIRKPYAFLIKNFRKIHVFLLLLSLFVAYKLFDVSSFVNEFMRLGTYDLFKNPITKHITGWLLFSIFLLIVGSTSLLFLLMHKKKPWKLYLVPVVEYIALFLVLLMIKSFFNGFSNDVETTDLRMSRDLLLMFTVAQLPVIAVYIMRVFGLDFKKFDFNSDKEFLELSEEDREEIEIGISFDKNTLLRVFRKHKRHALYLYEEHKNLCKALAIILGVIALFNIYHFAFVTHKSYGEGDNYRINGFTFKVNKAFFTDKDFNGNVIENGSNFVIVDLTIENHEGARTVYLENFHIRNGSHDSVTTNKTYAKEFRDLGATYDSVKNLKNGEVLNCIIVYKVPKNLKKDRFVLFYQENGGHLRKIKLKVSDVSKIGEIEKKQLGEDLDLGLRYKNDTVSFEYASIDNSVQYFTQNCNSRNCAFQGEYLIADDTYRILEIGFSSDTYEAKNMVDFLVNYGKLNYKDANDKEDAIELVNGLSKAYYGKVVYLKVPPELEEAKEVSLDLVIRNKHYQYQIIGGIYE